MENTQQFKVKASQSNLMFIFGGILVGLGVITYMATGQAQIIGPGAILVFIGILQKSKVLISLNEKHMELRLAPLSPLNLILYSDMDRLEEITPKKVFLHAKIDGKDRKLRLPMTSLTKEDQDSILSTIKQYTTSESLSA